MSSEQPPNNGDYEPFSEYPVCSDVGMKRLLGLMMETEDRIAQTDSRAERSFLLDELRAAFEHEGINEDELLATVSGKVRPKLQYDPSGEVSVEGENGTDEESFFPLQDENGPYRQLDGEEVALLEPALFSTYNFDTEEEYAHQVGFWCAVPKGMYEVPGYLHPDDIDSIELFQSTRSGASEVVSRYADLYNELQVNMREAADGDAFTDWLRQMYLLVPMLDERQIERLRIATERYIENRANFDEEPYQLVIEDFIEVEDDYGQKWTIETFPGEAHYVYMQGVSLRPEVVTEETVWAPYLRCRLLVRGPLADATLYIPIEGVLTFTPTVARGGQIVSGYEGIYPDDEPEGQSDVPYEHEASKEEQEARMAVQATYEQLEQLDSPHLTDMMEYIKESARLEDLFEISDELLEAYQITSLAWQDVGRRDRAAYDYRKDRERYREFSRLSFEDQAKVMKLDEEYAQQLARDEAMTREVMLAVLHKRLHPRMTKDERNELRELLYAKLAVDYQEPLGSSWYNLVDATLPGSPIDHEHSAILQRIDENEELNRQRSLREATIRNGISRAFYDGIAVDEADESYQLYRYICDEVADVPYLEVSDRQDVIRSVAARYALDATIIEQLVDIVERSSSFGL